MKHQQYVDIAKEEMIVDVSTDVTYYFGSEIATLRLLKNWRYDKRASQGYSETYQSFYVAFDRS